MLTHPFGCSIKVGTYVLCKHQLMLLFLTLETERLLGMGASTFDGLPGFCTPYILLAVDDCPQNYADLEALLGRSITTRSHSVVTQPIFMVYVLQRIWIWACWGGLWLDDNQSKRDRLVASSFMDRDTWWRDHLFRMFFEDQILLKLFSYYSS